MGLYQNAVSFTATFVFLVILALFLRLKGVITKAEAPTIAKITIDFVLPCLLLSKLPFIKPDHQILLTSLYLFLTEVLIAIFALFFGSIILRLQRPSLAVFILCSTFGSTAIIGSAFLTAIFHGDAQSIATGLLISQISVGIPAYIIMPIISIYFSSEANKNLSIIGILRQIALSPTIISIAVGLTWGIFELPTSGGFITPYFNALNYVGATLVFMVALLNGLALEWIDTKKEFIPIIFCSFFVLILEPLSVYLIDNHYGSSMKEMQISFILAAMPSANSVIAYSIRYNTDTKLAATLVTSTAILSAVSIPFFMPYFPIFN